MTDPAADAPAAGAPVLDLTDGVVRLRGWRAGDADAVHAACQDPRIARFVPIPQPYTMAVATGYVAFAAEATETGPDVNLAIVDPVSDTLLGAISRHGGDGHRAAFGYWLAPEARGRGVATRALRLLVDWTLETTGVIRFELYTDPDNDASGRVALRAGFEREGVRRAWDLDREGQPIDSVFYVRVRPDA